MGNIETPRIPIGENDFQSLFATHPSPMWVYDPKTLEFLTVNDAMLDLYGYSREQLAEMTVLDIRPSYERRRMQLAVNVRSDIERTGRWVHLKANGETFEVQTYGRSIRFNGVDAILAIVQDRTEFNEAQRRLDETQTILNAIIENMPNGVFVKDIAAESAYIIFNAVSGANDGKDPADVLGRRDVDIFPAHIAQTFLASDQVAITSGEPYVYEAVHQIADGATRIIKTTKKMLQVGDGSAPRFLLGVSEDVTEARMFERKLEKLALEDTLTGLANRAAFVDGLNKAIKKGGVVALAFLDVDNFKDINDTGGHSAGDALLRQLAVRLTSTLPDTLIARLGGDEFALVGQLADVSDVEAFGQKVQTVFAEPFALENGEEMLSCSLGIALAPHHAGADEDLLRLADIALYAAKEAGRATFRVYSPIMSAAAQRRRQMSVELREAITRNELELDFQPLFRLGDRSLAGFEALVRWRHPRFGLIGPGHFIDLAEATGLISQLGEWVLRRACAVASAWPEKLTVAVNLSARQMQGADIVKAIKSALDESGLAPQRLDLEITESVFVGDAQHSLVLFKSLKALGVKISIDDFGTGYSSLAYLRDFPFDKIKLDRSFITDLESNNGSLSIAKAVVAIASGFGAITVAEGVETESQASALTELGFDLGQGYHLGRPLTLDAAEALIASHQSLEAPVQRRLKRKR
ncbi:EAL domain-containing protein [Rhizobium sp. FKL33]|uniref:putative bifunctional diguanylate cyclase/phosphodiesterase n=1 Tax=Rhizobium sp. FKL33 TaxID=2562307 RepID=UPI0010C07FB0|nr:EAL domain-containing protein [Rhizobium sp. FKL33]